MRCITYAGETVITTDDVAAVLLELTAALANLGKAESVSIPIVRGEDKGLHHADLVIGVGNDVLSVPEEWEGAEPDFSDAAQRLQSTLNKLTPRVVAYAIPDEDDKSFLTDFSLFDGGDSNPFR